MTTSAQAPSLLHPPSFGVLLHQAMRAYGPLCAGVDPHRGLMQAWGLDYTVAGLERFAMTCAEAFAGRVAAVKPQSAFFEVFGSAGVAVLERLVADLRAAGTLVILDVKRGDIGTTMDAYAEAFLGKDAPEPPDAITLSPYLGYGSLRPAIDLAHATGRGVFVLALTSNPEGADVQHAVLHGQSVAGHVVAGATADNADAVARGELGSVGLVVGATVGDAVDRMGLDRSLSSSRGRGARRHRREPAPGLRHGAPACPGRVQPGGPQRRPQRRRAGHPGTGHRCGPGRGSGVVTCGVAAGGPPCDQAGGCAGSGRRELSPVVATGRTRR